MTSASARPGAPKSSGETAPGPSNGGAGFQRTIGEADLAELKRNREEADRRYNESLSELDAAIQLLPDFPHPPPAPDESQVSPLNERWEIMRAAAPLPGGWRGRIARLAWAIAAPVFESQQAFNAVLVDHINRNVEQQRAVVRAIDAAIDALRQQIELVIRFETRLILYLQQITPYVDTKDYEFRGLNQRVIEDVAEAQWDLARTVRGLAAALSGVSDDVLKRWERYEGLRASVAALHQLTQALKREVERQSREVPKVPGVPEVPRVQVPGVQVPRVQVPGVLASEAPGIVGPKGTSSTESTLGTLASRALSSDPLESQKYVGFEDAFRGDPALIRSRQENYLPLFIGQQDVLDIGCGRGEFLHLLKERDVPARGIDLNHAMVAKCQEEGLDVVEADALSYLRTLGDGSLGGLIAAQVVEHLQPDYLLALLNEAFRVLRPGSPIALETINVGSWSAFFNSYVRDLTHARPIHPDTLRFLVLAAGFLDAEVRLTAPLPDEEKLPRSSAEVRNVDLRSTGVEGRAVLSLADSFDAAVDRLNRQLYGPQDYAVVAWKR